MTDLTIFFIYFSLLLLAEGLMAWGALWLASKKGRDTIGWFLTGFFFGPIGLLLLLALPAIETRGQTKRCQSCGQITRWQASVCPACEAAIVVSESVPQVKIRRPLRAFYLYGFILIILLLIIFGFIGYYCVPNQPG